MASLIAKFGLKVDNEDMPCPAVFNWGLNDVSAAESGRTDDTIMHKNRVGQKRKIELQWNCLDPEDTKRILQAFNPEYIQVTYYDPMDGDFETRTFYTGDKEAPLKFWYVGNQIFESLSFNIIEV